MIFLKFWFISQITDSLLCVFNCFIIDGKIVGCCTDSEYYRVTRDGISHWEELYLYLKIKLLVHILHCRNTFWERFAISNMQTIYPASHGALQMEKQRVERMKMGASLLWEAPPYLLSLILPPDIWYNFAASFFVWRAKL